MPASILMMFRDAGSILLKLQLPHWNVFEEPLVQQFINSDSGGFKLVAINLHTAFSISEINFSISIDFKLLDSELKNNIFT